MPIPLPNLDTRRWGDLVGEGRALIPRYAPSWTDHNFHDPGITLMELMAWVVEQEIYRANQVPDRHRLKFLRLLGLAPQPPQPAQAVLAIQPSGAGPTPAIPAGASLVAQETIPFLTRQVLKVVPAGIAAVLSFDGANYLDQTRLWREGLPYPLLGNDPGPESAFYLGFDQALPIGETVRLWFWFDGSGRDQAERERILQEARELAESCQPLRPDTQPCEPEAGENGEERVGDLPAHHSLRTVWEYYDGSDWLALDPEQSQVQDETRSLTLDGAVEITLPAEMQATSPGDVADSYYYMRCRVSEGRPDAAPRLLAVALNAVAAEQVTSYENTVIGTGKGAPEEAFSLPEAPVAQGQILLRLEEEGDWQTWQQKPDLDASGRTDPHFTLEATTGVVTFGDGQNGRVPPKGSAIAATYRATKGSAGNLPAGAAWHFADAALEAAFQVANPRPTAGGSDEEELDHVAGRAAATLWAHERLVELCPAGQATLDQLERKLVLSRIAPRRATTLLDYERITLDIPGVEIARARAWAGIDPTYPCLKAPGTVTVVILPSLPAGRPEPTPGLLSAVTLYLHRRRIAGTRLVVVGPQYLEVQVLAKVQAKRGTDAIRVEGEIHEQLNAFLDPLAGGPDGRGWPFGRYVYRSEILQIIDNVPGVDHVLELELSGNGGEPQCGNLCLDPTWLVAPAEHDIEVVGE